LAALRHFRFSPSGNKTSPRFGSSDFWIVRIDDQGNKLWEQSFGGSGSEGKQWRTSVVPRFSRERIKRTADAGFLLTGFSASPVSGVKTAPLISQGDYWVLKLNPEPPFLRCEITAEGQTRLCLIGPPEFEHTIQGSADLTTWTDLAKPPTRVARFTGPIRTSSRIAFTGPYGGDRGAGPRRGDVPAVLAASAPPWSPGSVA